MKYRKFEAITISCFSVTDNWIEIKKRKQNKHKQKQKQKSKKQKQKQKQNPPCKIISKLNGHDGITFKFHDLFIQGVTTSVFPTGKW